jgi:branched-chain amino acid transport system permease protein
MAMVAQTQQSAKGTKSSWVRWLQAAAWLAALVCVLGFPYLFNDGFSVTIGFYTVLLAAAAVAWNIFAGYTGYIALGHVVFWGVAQYALAIICLRWHIPGGYVPFWLVPVAGLIAALFAIPLGFIALRTRRHTFIVITIAFVFIFQLLAENNVGGLTGGSSGIFYPIMPGFGVAALIPFYFVIAAILILIVGVSWLVRHSKYGLELLAIRDDEDRALGLGVRTTALKLSAFTLSAFLIGMCGAVCGYFQFQVYPAEGTTTGFTPLFDIFIVLMAFLGGLGTISGPLIGAIIVYPVYLYLNADLPQSGWNYIIFGAMFLVVVLLLPQGIVPALGQLALNLRDRMNGGQQLAAEPPEASAAPVTPAERR